MQDKIKVIGLNIKKLTMNKYSFIMIEGDRMREKDPKKIQKIYNATLELVVEEGIDAINISKIAKKSGVASGTIYIYFENKEVLLNELYSYVCNLWQEKVDLKENSDDFRENLYKIWNENIKFSFSNYNEMYFKMLFMHSKYIDNFNKNKNFELIIIFYKMFDMAKEKGLVKDISSELIYSMVEGTMFQVINYLKKINNYDKKIIDDSFRFCWHGIRN